MGMTGAIKGVILAADSGKRNAAGWSPRTGLLLPVANVSMVERILDAYARAGVKETLIAAGRDAREAASICGNGRRWNMALTCRDQPEARSAHDVMKEIAAFAGEAAFLATRGPVLLDTEAYLHAVQIYGENDPRGVCLWEREGVASGDAFRSDGCDGIYLLPPHACDVFDESGGAGERTCSFGSFLDMQAGRGERMPTMTPAGEPYDMDTPEAYLESNERLIETTARGLELPDIMADNFSSPHLVLTPPVALDDSADLERCRIGPGVCIGPGVRIGHGAAIEHSVIMEGADIGDGASISRAIIGKNASIANRSVIHGRIDRVTVA